MSAWEIKSVRVTSLWHWIGQNIGMCRIELLNQWPMTSHVLVSPTSDLCGGGRNCDSRCFVVRQRNQYWVPNIRKRWDLDVHPMCMWNYESGSTFRGDHLLHLRDLRFTEILGTRSLFQICRYHSLGYPISRRGRWRWRLSQNDVGDPPQESMDERNHFYFNAPWSSRSSVPSRHCRASWGHMTNIPVVPNISFFLYKYLCRVRFAKLPLYMAKVQSKSSGCHFMQ